MKIRTTNVAQTQAVAAALAELVQAKDLLLLTGDLGSGKTAFTQGFGAALAVTERITSPTFVLLRSYEGRIPLNHIDAYRLEDIEEVADLGLSELLDGPAVTLIEWAERVRPTLPANFLDVRLTFGDDPDERLLDIEPVGPTWAARSRTLHTALTAVEKRIADGTVAGPGDSDTAPPAADNEAGH